MNFYHLDATTLYYSDVYFSNRIKDALLNTHLTQFADDEIILFTDAIDAVFVAEQKEIIDKFNHFNCPLLFSAEVNCWPDKSMEKNYPAPSVHFRYLNSGAFIGRAGYLKYLYEKYPIFEIGKNPAYFWSNQYYWNLVFQNESANIQLDHSGELFFNTSITISNIDEFKRDIKDPEKLKMMCVQEKARLDKEISFSEDRIINNLTGSKPCHIHFPGTVSKKLMDGGYFDRLKKYSSVIC